MKLREYLSQPGITASALAERCGVAVSTITRVAKGNKEPSADLMRKIREHTGHAVTADELI